MTEAMSENLKNKIMGKISAIKLSSNVYTVTQAAFNLEPAKSTGYIYDSDRMLPRIKKYLKAKKHFIFAAEVFRT